MMGEGEVVMEGSQGRGGEDGQGKEEVYGAHGSTIMLWVVRGPFSVGVSTVLNPDVGVG